MELSIKGRCIRIKSTEKAHKYGQMELDIKEYGIKIRQMVKEFYGILMAIDFKVNLKIKKQMDLAFIFIIME